MKKLALQGVICVAAACTVGPSLAANADGPFGVYMGMPIAELRSAVPGLVETKSRPNEYLATQAPVPNDAFSFYSYSISEKAGLCAIRAIERGLNEFQAQDMAEQVAGRLSAKYGEPWMRGETGQALWRQQGLPNDLASISVQVIDSEGQDKKSVFLSYRFKNSSECAPEPIQVSPSGL